jgi:pyridoxamine 5'-phosphate oxidase family protein
MFSSREKAYLHEQRLARLATVNPQGQPDVVPVGYDFDGDHFFIGGRRMQRTVKYHNVKSNQKVALVIDDLESTDPWLPRGIKVRGVGELVEREAGYAGPGVYIQLTPESHRSWGIYERS